MTRLQILELPEGPDDHRPPFVLVVDEYAPRRYVLGVGQAGQPRSEFDGVAEAIGARAVLTFVEQVEIPSNEIAAEFHEGVRESVAELYESASSALSSSVMPRIEDVERKLSESETLGHTLLQRAERAEAVTAHTRGLMERRTRTLSERAERAEEKLTALAKQDTERMDAITDALGFDRLRDWDEIVSAIKRQRRMDAEGGHLFGEPGFRDPLRCANCRLYHSEWVLRGTRCDAVRAENGGE